MARTPFKMKSGNTTPFKMMGSSPCKNCGSPVRKPGDEDERTVTTTWNPEVTTTRKEGLETITDVTQTGEKKTVIPGSGGKTFEEVGVTPEEGQAYWETHPEEYKEYLKKKEGETIVEPLSRARSSRVSEIQPIPIQVPKLPPVEIEEELNTADTSKLYQGWGSQEELDAAIERSKKRQRKNRWANLFRRKRKRRGGPRKCKKGSTDCPVWES